MRDPVQEKVHQRWHSRARHTGRQWRHSFRRSLRLRLMTLFVLLALAMTVIFVGGMQKAMSVGWRDAVRPLLADYVDRLAADIGSPPDLVRAQALVKRLPISVRISGPVVNWDSHPLQRRFHHEDDWSLPPQTPAEWKAARLGPGLLERTTADGHHIRFGLGDLAWESQPRQVGWITLFALLVLTALAYVRVRRLLRPLDDIRAGAERFGAGNFSRPIPLRRRDELGDLAHRINTMAHDIRQMLDAKRAMLLAISHELRSPLTRARLNVELLPETAETQTQREALLRDLAGMRDLITGLMESERLASRHAALNLETTDLGALAREVLAEMAQLPGDDAATGGAAPAVQAEIDPGLPLLQLDRVRVRLLLRNLLDNAQRHSAGAAQPPLLRLAATPEGVLLQVRDHGPGVTEEQLPHLAEPFYRADAARQRATGGIGLGLYLCRLVAQAHGAGWSVRNAQPGLVIGVSFPLPPAVRAGAPGVPGG